MKCNNKNKIVNQEQKYFKKQVYTQKQIDPKYFKKQVYTQKQIDPIIVTRKANRKVCTKMTTKNKNCNFRKTI